MHVNLGVGKALVTLLEILDAFSSLVLATVVFPKCYCNMDGLTSKTLLI